MSPPRSTRAPIPVTLLAFAAIVAPRAARADDLTAEQLYRDGRRAAQRGDWATACDDFRASQEREPAPGTLLNLADCEEHRDLAADALAHFEAAARGFKAGDDRLAYARRRAAAVAKKVATLTLRLASDADAAGVEVTLDGAPLAAGSLGGPARINPGTHVLELRAPKHQVARTSIRLAMGEAREVVLAPGAAVADAPPPAPAPATATRTTPSDDTPPPSEPPATTGPRPAAGSPWRTLGYVSLGLGAASLGAGVAGGLLTLGAKSTADANCPSTGCNPTGIDAERSGKTWSTIGTVGFVAGGVGLAAGAALLWLAPSANGAVVAEPARGGARVDWVGRF